jgi:DNA-binding CsgD family transcriptional regulator
MVMQAAPNAKKGASAKCSEPKPEELIRSLVSQVTTAIMANPCGEHPPDGHHREEIILDMDLDGARYLLVRLPKADRPRVQLSPREQEIVRMVAHGHPNKIIADILAISSWTVCTHLRRIFAKLGVTSRAAMVARMLETGSVIGPTPPFPEASERSGRLSGRSPINSPTGI